MNMYEQMKKAIANMKAEQIREEIEKIQIEKKKRYDYHKKYNQTKKEFEIELKKKFEALQK